MAYTALTVTKSYDGDVVLTEVDLDAVKTSIENWANNVAIKNALQIAYDVFGNTYTYNNDGIQTLATPLVDLAGKLDENEIITGSWNFQGATAFQAAVAFSGSAIVSSSVQPRVKGYLDIAVQTIANTTFTSINLNAEEYDVGTMHDNAVNITRLNIPNSSSGLYLLQGQVSFAGNATGVREIRIIKNGSTTTPVGRSTDAAFNSTQILNVSALVQATASDYFELQAYQSSGGNLDVNYGADSTFFSAIKVW